MQACQLVVPCYNEAARLRADAFEQLVHARPEVSLLFVNDGSTDATLRVLDELAARAPERIRVLDRQPNRGKAASVHHGMRVALASDAALVGYWDADLSTPLCALPELASTLERDPERLIVLAARVRLLGRSIQRDSLRHYAGRLFASAVSALLGLAVYDTQCGAKLFRVNDLTRALFEAPFVTDWSFDVELLARLVSLHRQGRAPAPERIVYELPLRQWHDVAGSKVTAVDFPRALAELVRIYLRYLH